MRKFLDEMIEIPVALLLALVITTVASGPLPPWASATGALVSALLLVRAWIATRRSDKDWTECPYCSTRVRCNIPGVAHDAMAQHVRIHHSEEVPS